LEGWLYGAGASESLGDDRDNTGPSTAIHTAVQHEIATAKAEIVEKRGVAAFPALTFLDPVRACAMHNRS
jgi:hypothetical protein